MPEGKAIAEVAESVIETLMKEKEIENKDLLPTKVTLTAFTKIECSHEIKIPRQFFQNNGKLMQEFLTKLYRDLDQTDFVDDPSLWQEGRHTWEVLDQEEKKHEHK